MGTNEPGDRTARALRDQLQARAAVRVEIGLLHGPTNRMTSRIWTPDEAQAALMCGAAPVGWLASVTLWPLACLYRRQG